MFNLYLQSGPSCSKLTTSLVNDSLKFTLSDTQICWIFFAEKMWVAFAVATYIFSAKNIRILYVESAKIVNEMTLNELVKLTALWTTGPCSLYEPKRLKCTFGCMCPVKKLISVFTGRLSDSQGYKVFPCEQQGLSLRKHAYSNMLKILPPKNENFQIKTSDIFHVSAQNIDCGYSLDPPYWGGSNEYQQSMFWADIRNIYHCKPQFYYIKMGFKGVRLRAVDEQVDSPLGTCVRRYVLSLFGSYSWICVELVAVKTSIYWPTSYCI